MSGGGVGLVEIPHNCRSISRHLSKRARALLQCRSTGGSWDARFYENTNGLLNIQCALYAFK